MQKIAKLAKKSPIFTTCASLVFRLLHTDTGFSLLGGGGGGGGGIGGSPPPPPLTPTSRCLTHTHTHTHTTLH